MTEVSFESFQNYQEKLKRIFQKEISSKDAIIEQLKKECQNLKAENKKLAAEKEYAIFLNMKNMQDQLDQLCKETKNLTYSCSSMYNNQTDDLDSLSGGYTESHTERYYLYIIIIINVKLYLLM